MEKMIGKLIGVEVPGAVPPVARYRWSKVVDESPSFIAYVTPSGKRCLTSRAAIERLVNKGKIVLREDYDDYQDAS